MDEQMKVDFIISQAWENGPLIYRHPDADGIHEQIELLSFSGDCQFIAQDNELEDEEGWSGDFVVLTPDKARAIIALMEFYLGIYQRK